MIQDYDLTDYEAINNYLNECLDGEDLLCFLSQDYPAFTCTLSNLGAKTTLEISCHNDFLIYLYSKSNEYIGLMRFNKLSVLHTVNNEKIETIDDLEELS